MVCVHETEASPLWGRIGTRRRGCGEGRSAPGGAELSFLVILDDGGGWWEIWGWDPWRVGWGTGF